MKKFKAFLIPLILFLGIVTVSLAAVTAKASDDYEEGSNETNELPESAALLLATYDLDRSVNADIAKKHEEAGEKAKKEADRKRAIEEKKQWEASHVRAPGYDTVITMTEYEYLCRLVQAESGNMDEMSRRYVASSIMNRLIDANFPNDLVSIVTQNNGRTWQYSPVAPGGTYWTCSVSDATRSSVEHVLQNGDIANGATYFVAKAATTGAKAAWFDNNLTHIFYHAGHDYYKE